MIRGPMVRLFANSRRPFTTDAPILGTNGLRCGKRTAAVRNAERGKQATMSNASGGPGLEGDDRLLSIYRPIRVRLHQGANGDRAEKMQ